MTMPMTCPMATSQKHNMLEAAKLKTAKHNSRTACHLLRWQTRRQRLAPDAHSLEEQPSGPTTYLENIDHNEDILKPLPQGR